MITWMQTHRKYLVPTIWISTIAFVGAGFVGWGAYDYGNDKSGAVAQVGEISITSGELQSTYSNVFGYYNQMFGGTLTKEKAEQLNLQDIALNKLTNEALLLNYANELGIKALDQDVMDEYTSIKAFQEDGVFNKEKYEQILRAQGKKQKAFEQELEKSVILKKLQAILSIPTTDLEAEASFAAATLADHLVVKKISQDLESISISEESIKNTWESNKNDYMSKISYLLETIKVSSSDFEVSDEKVSEFYNEKKYKFKDAEGKILALADAKEAVVKAVQLQDAKRAVLKKYLAFKKGELTASNEMLVDASTAPFPFIMLKDSKEGSYLKAIELADGYLTARVKTINKPQPLAYQDAKASVEAKLRQEKANQLLQDKAKVESASLTNGKDIGFITLESHEALKEILTPNEATQFIKYLFSKNDKNGYFILGNSALIYNVTEQSLFNQEKFNAEQNNTAQNISSMKSNVLESGLIKELKKKYQIQLFIKEG